LIGFDGDSELGAFEIGSGLVLSDGVLSANGVGMQPALRPIISGEFIDNGMNAAATGAYVMGLQHMIIAPFFVSKGFSIDQAGISVTNHQNPSTAKVVFYDSNESSLPKELVFETGELDTSTNGYKSENKTFTFLDNRWYWIGLWASHNISIRSLGVGAAFNLFVTSNNSNTYRTMLRQTGLASPPSTFDMSNVNVDFGGSVGPPSIRMRLV
jgi:hypothetical protein